MITRPPYRLISALLLVPCLLADPITAFAAVWMTVSPVAPFTDCLESPVFKDQAIPPRSELFLHPSESGRPSGFQDLLRDAFGHPVESDDPTSPGAHGKGVWRK